MLFPPRWGGGGGSSGSSGGIDFTPGGAALAAGERQGISKRHPRWTHRLFSDADLEAIAAALAAAERATSGEIRVHLEPRLPRRGGEPGDALTRALEVFTTLRMQATVERSGVLIYLAVDDRKLAIVGDTAVHARVGDAYWQRVRDGMVERLRRGDARDAVLHAVGEVGEMAAALLPPPAGRSERAERPGEHELSGV